MVRTGTGSQRTGTTNAPGRNEVEIKPLGGRGGYYRSYEIYGRVREKESQHLVNPRRLLRRDYLLDPYPTLALIRENYELFRDWISNADWVTRYNDVTSIFVDEASFETRPKLWFYGLEGYGRDLRGELPVLFAWANGVEGAAPAVIDGLIGEFASRGEADLVGDFTYRYPTRLLARALRLPRETWDQFGRAYWTMMDGWQWDPVRAVAGRRAMDELTAMFRPLLEACRMASGEDLISAIAGLELRSGPTTAEDVVVTLLEGDGETLFGGLNNVLFQILARPDVLSLIDGDHLLAKRAWQEAIRYSPPTLQARRYARHEVERYGRLFPEGGLVYCSAAAGNRDPRQFADPDVFNVHRRDLCYREPRGQYRADGLPAGIALGLGGPSRHPAIPEDRPRSLYAITMDLSVLALERLLTELRDLRLAPGAEPQLFCRWPLDTHTCWHLPVVFHT